MDFSWTIVVYDIKVGKFSLLNDHMNHYEYQRSRSFTELRPRSLRFNIFNLPLLRNRQADWSQISYGASMRCGEWKFVQMFQVTWSCPYKLWWKTSKIFFFGTKRPMTLKLGIQHRVLEHYQYFIWWPWVDLGYFYDRVKFVSECFCKGESLYSIDSYCISKFVLILHILSTQVSDTGPMVL